MQAPLYNQNGATIGTVDLDAYIFGIEPHVPVMHQAMVRQQANARLGTHNTLGRGEVKGSTRKLFKQKGTGRARQGSVRAPHRKGGGVAHGPHPRKYTKMMPKKMRRLAVRSALSAKMASNELRFIDALNFSAPRTKEMITTLSALNVRGSILIVLAKRDENVQRSANNLPKVKTLMAHYLNVVDLLQYEHVIISQAALDVIASYLSNPQGVASGEEA
jgi:large subunit ribosomal protein L4